MRRSDPLLLAYLAARRRPASRAAIKAVLQATPGRLADLSSGAFAQALIRAKAISPQDYVALQRELEGARRACACGRPVVALPGARERRRRCPCGHVTVVAASRDGASPARGEPAGPDPGAESDPVLSPRTTRRLPKRIGPYPILDRVGDGGMGVIFKAQDPATQGVVALKVLRPGASADAEERFRRETEAIARLRHPAIIRVHDVGTDERGRHYFTMDFVEGRELGQVRRELGRRRFLEVVATVAEGLHHAHEQGIIHRDVKPQNIIVEASGSPRIADFGLARDLERSSLTEEGDLVGTPLYMAPEQLRGDPNAIDRRTDVYALGVLLYEGLADRLPIDARSLLELQRRIVEVVPAPPSSHDPTISRDLDRIVAKALEKRPEDRYFTAEDLARDLRRHLAGEAVGAAPTSSVARAARRARDAASLAASPRGLAALAAAALLVLVGAAVVHRVRAAQAASSARARLDGLKAQVTAGAHAATRALTEGRAALVAGDVEGARAALARCRAAAAGARDLALGLGEDAPGPALAEVDAARAAADELEADVQAQGGVEERAAARRRYLALIERRPRDAGLRVAVGRLELRDGHVDQAYDHLSRALALEPGRPDALVLRARAHRTAGRADYAELDYAQALGAAGLPGPLELEAATGRALTRVALGKLEQAQEDVERAATRRPDAPAVAVARAAVLEARGRRGDALLLLEQAARVAPRAPELRLALGRAAARAGDLPRARAELDLAVELDPGPDTWLARARVLALLGAAGADDDLGRALALARPEDPGRRAALLVRARHARGEGRLPGALEDLDQALAGAPASAPADALPLLLERAELRLLDGAPQALGQAARDLERALAADPGAPRAARLAAWLALARGDAAGALRTALAALARRPEDPEGLAARARALAALGDPGALAAAREARLALDALLADPRLPELEVTDPLGEALHAYGRGRVEAARARARPAGEPARREGLERARGWFERARRLTPWLAPAEQALARALADLGAAEPALAALEALDATGLADDRAHEARAALLAARGRHADAVGALDRALTWVEALPAGPARDRRAAALRTQRARARLELGHDEAALADLDAAVASDGKAVEPRRLRAEVRRRRGDAAGADADLAQVTLLRQTYVQTVEQAIRDAWARRSGGEHERAARELTRGFDVVSRATDPLRLAELHRVRAFLRVRSLALPEALLDLAAMIELTPHGFTELFDEVVPLDPQQPIDFPLVVARARELAPSEALEVDPDFLSAFIEYVAVEWGRSADAAVIRRGLRAIGHFLDRAPTHASGLLIRARLLRADGRPTEAARTVEQVLAGGDPPAYAHYERARLLALRGEREAALGALRAALEARFTVYRVIHDDPALAALREDPRFARMVAVSQGTGYLSQVDRVELLMGDLGGAPSVELARTSMTALTTGLGYVQRFVAEGDPHARAIAAQLLLARARQGSRAGDGRAAARDLVAAIEASPLVVLAWDQLREGCALAKEVPPAWLLGARPPDGERLPARLPTAAPAVVRALAGERLTPDAAQEAERALGGDDAGLDLARGVLRLAAGDAPGALAAAEALARAPAWAPAAAWLEARARAARSEPEAALAALARAVEGGLRGALVRDPGLRPLVGQARFAELAREAAVPADQQHRWR